jgi:hypothetical protein
VFLLRLARIALAAEELRLRRLIRRAIIRVTLGGVAMMLLLGALVFGHIAAWEWLRRTLPGHEVALIFTGVDLVLGFILVVIAARSSPGTIERDALAVRERALDEAVESMTVTAMLIRLIDTLVPPRPKE